MSRAVDTQGLREFLAVYNILTETCFTTCAVDFNTRQLTNDEIGCVERCVHKSTATNRRIITVFADIGPILQQRNREEEQQKQLVALAVEKQQQ